MSSALAIAAVTAVLRNLLDNGLIDDQVAAAVGSVNVTARAPDLITLDQNSPSQLNLFLYHVTPNAAWRNVGLPSRDARGERLTNPPLALDLHYLLTAYAARDLHAEILLGYGMQLLHESPTLPREAIRVALGVSDLVDNSSSALPAELTALGGAGLAEQIEAIKIVPEALSGEETSKLWAAFQTHYRPSAAYIASVVLIQAQRSTRAALPVRARGLYVAVFKEPFVDQVLGQETSRGPARNDLQILSHHQLVLRGSNLKGGDVTWVRVGRAREDPDPALVQDAQIILNVPSGLSAGAHSIQVVHERLMGKPEERHAGVSSNLSAFVLHPRITAQSVRVSGGEKFVQVTIDPPVLTQQQVVLMLNEKPVPSSPPSATLPRAFSFTAPSRTEVSPPGPVADVEFCVTGATPGTYLVRVLVDGAESPLTADSSGLFSSPSVTIS